MPSQGNWSAALAETLLCRYPNPDNYPYRDWCYPQGFMLWGMEKLWQSTGARKYYDYIMKYAAAHVDTAGNIKGFSGESLDDIMAGSILVWAYQQTGLTQYKLACDRIRAVFDTYPRTSEGGLWHAAFTPFEMWVDGAFMGQMFLTKYGKYIGDSKYCFDEAALQLTLIEKHCKKEDSGLLVHAWCEDKKAAWADPATGCAPEVWSEGLGWYALILMETLEVFPAAHPQREQLVRQLQSLLEVLRNTQDAKTGLWYQVVDKGHLSDNWHDTSGSAMFLYAIQRAVESGLAHPAVFGPVVARGYQGLVTKAKINEAGLVDIYDACDGLCVQKSYADYINYPQTVNAKEAVAAFLWATGIVEKPQSK